MADPVSLQVLDAIKTRLSAISVVVGYNNTPSVVRLGTLSANPDELADGPAISVFDLGDDPDEGDFSQTKLITQEVLIEAFIATTDDGTEALSLLWQDISRAVFLADTTLGGIAAGVMRGPRQFSFPNDGGNVAGLRQTVVVQYFETYGNP